MRSAVNHLQLINSPSLSLVSSLQTAERSYRCRDAQPPGSAVTAFESETVDFLRCLFRSAVVLVAPCAAAGSRGSARASIDRLARE